jgi:hypothetical protein
MTCFFRESSCWFNGALCCRYVAVQFDRLRVPTGTAGVPATVNWYGSLGLFTDGQLIRRPPFVHRRCRKGGSVSVNGDEAAHRKRSTSVGASHCPIRLVPAEGWKSRQPTRLNQRISVILKQQCRPAGAAAACSGPARRHRPNRAIGGLVAMQRPSWAPRPWSMAIDSSAAAMPLASMQTGGGRGHLLRTQEFRGPVSLKYAISLSGHSGSRSPPTLTSSMREAERRDVRAVREIAGAALPAGQQPHRLRSRDMPAKHREPPRSTGRWQQLAHERPTRTG